MVSGESLGQVASQTLTNIARIDEAAAMPILRPLVGSDKLEIVAEAKRLGTYEISIEPDLDCCTLFTPRHPATAVGARELARAEERLDMPRLIEPRLRGCGPSSASPSRPAEQRSPWAERSPPSWLA